jgi:hypothetical protein
VTGLKFVAMTLSLAENNPSAVTHCPPEYISSHPFFRRSRHCQDKKNICLLVLLWTTMPVGLRWLVVPVYIRTPTPTLWTRPFSSIKPASSAFTRINGQVLRSCSERTGRSCWICRLRRLREEHPVPVRQEVLRVLEGLPLKRCMFPGSCG